MKNSIMAFFICFSIMVFGLSACAPKAQTTSPDSSVNAPASLEQEGTISISGAFALYPMMTRWAEEYQKANPNVQFDISAGGAGKGMTDALSNAVDIGMVSRTVTQDEMNNGAYPIAVTKDAVFPVISSQNPVYTEIMSKGITQEMFVKIFITSEITTWGEVVGNNNVTDEIHVYTRSDSCGAAEMWAKFLGGAQDDLVGIGVNGDPGLLQAVVSDSLGIGFNNLGYVFDLTTGNLTAGISPIPIDVNGDGAADADEVVSDLSVAVDLISSEKYPFPPARLEFLVTNGKPSGLVNSFITWILTDGQQFVGEAGYVQLTEAQLNESLEKLK